MLHFSVILADRAPEWGNQVFPMIGLLRIRRKMVGTGKFSHSRAVILEKIKKFRNVALRNIAGHRLLARAPYLTVQVIWRVADWPGRRMTLGKCGVLTALGNPWASRAIPWRAWGRYSPV